MFTAKKGNLVLLSESYLVFCIKPILKNNLQNCCWLQTGRQFDIQQCKRTVDPVGEAVLNNEVLHPGACVILVTVVGLHWICIARGYVLYKLHVFPRADQIAMVIKRDDLHVQINNITRATKTL